MQSVSKRPEHGEGDQQGDRVGREDPPGQDLLTLLLDNLTESVTLWEVATDGTMRCLQANRASFLLSGLSQDQLIGRYLEEIVPDGFRQAPRWRILEVCRTGQAFHFEETIDLPVGRRLFSISLTVVRPPVQPLSRLLCLARDVTEWRLAEEERDHFFELAMDLLCVADANGYFLRVNPAFEQALGRRAEELCSKPFVDFLHPDDVAPTLEQYRLVLAGKDLGYFENRYLARDGTWRWLAWSCRAIKPGVPVLYACARDITERKQFEEGLQRSQARLRAIIDAEPECVKLLDADGRFLEINPAGLKMIEAESLAQVRGRSVFDFIVPEDGAAFRGLHERICQGQSGRLEFAVIGLCGTRRDVETHAVPWRDERGIYLHLAVTRDVTERKTAERRLRLSEERLSRAQAIAHLGYWDWDIVAGSLAWSDEVYRIFGLTPQEFGATYEAFLAAVHPDDRHKVRTAVIAALEQRARYHIEHRIVRPDSTIRFVVEQGEVTRDAGGKPVRMLGTVQDITEQKHAEELLRSREERLRAIIETATDLIWEMDRDGLHTYASARITSILGYTPEEFCGARYADFIHPDDLREIEDRLPRLIAARSGWTNWVVRFRHKDGTYRYLESSAVPILDEQENCVGFRGADRDVTERKQSEERLQLVQAELAHAGRLSVMGEMTAGLAHELNQPLSAIANYANACIRLIDAGTADRTNLRQALTEVSGQAMRAGDIIRWLRSFAAQRITQPTEVHVHELIAEVLRLLETELRLSEITLHVEMAPDLPAVEVDRIQIQQVIMNLIRNALEAMKASPQRRELVLRVRRSDRATIQVEVCDTGPGLAPEVAGRLFEPFQTTKPAGLGLGLAISRTVIEAHAGVLSSRPNPGGGTIFSFSLPLPLGQSS